MPAQPLTAAQKEDAARLKAIYEAKKGDLRLTQIALAALCGWESQGSVSQYLNGKIPLNVDAAAKLARSLKCSIDDFSPSLARELRELGSGLAPEQPIGLSTLPGDDSHNKLLAPVHPLPPTDPPEIAAVVALMRATDDTGRAMALGAVKGALAGYVPRAKANDVP